jgi:hypothetical protein
MAGFGGPKNMDIARAATCASVLPLYAKGMGVRGYTGRELLNIATEYTGKTYKRGQYAEAKTDMDAFLAENRMVNDANNHVEV